jgi:hypothetical protein
MFWLEGGRRGNELAFSTLFTGLVLPFSLVWVECEGVPNSFALATGLGFGLEVLEGLEKRGCDGANGFWVEWGDLKEPGMPFFDGAPNVLGVGPACEGALNGFGADVNVLDELNTLGCGFANGFGVEAGLFNESDWRACDGAPKVFGANVGGLAAPNAPYCEGAPNVFEAGIVVVVGNEPLSDGAPKGFVRGLKAGRVLAAPKTPGCDGLANGFGVGVLDEPKVLTCDGAPNAATVCNVFEIPPNGFVLGVEIPTEANPACVAVPNGFVEVVLEDGVGTGCDGIPNGVGTELGVLVAKEPRGFAECCPEA